MFQVKQRIHKKKALFSSKDNSKKLKCHLLHFLFGTLKGKVKSQIKLPPHLYIIYIFFSSSTIYLHNTKCISRPIWLHMSYVIIKVFVVCQQDMTTSMKHEIGLGFAFVYPTLPMYIK